MFPKQNRTTKHTVSFNKTPNKVHHFVLSSSLWQKLNHKKFAEFREDWAGKTKNLKPSKKIMNSLRKLVTCKFYWESTSWEVTAKMKWNPVSRPTREGLRDASKLEMYFCKRIMKEYWIMMLNVNKIHWVTTSTLPRSTSDPALVVLFLFFHFNCIHSKTKRKVFSLSDPQWNTFSLCWNLVALLSSLDSFSTVELPFSTVELPETTQMPTSKESWSLELLLNSKFPHKRLFTENKQVSLVALCLEESPFS